MNAGSGFRPLIIGSYKRQQARISRGRLYPMTIFYAIYSAIMLTLGWRSAHRYLAVGFYVLGIPVWTLVEYLFHRYVLHHTFPETESKGMMGIIDRFCHKVLDPLHRGHHERPNDGMHINGV